MAQLLEGHRSILAVLIGHCHRLQAGLGVFVQILNELKKALDETTVCNARFPVYTNVSARPATEKEEIKNQLFRQVTSPVLWEETITNMVNDGIDQFVEIGPGKVLQGLVKRINPDIKCFGIDKYSEMEKYL